MQNMDNQSLAKVILNQNGVEVFLIETEKFKTGTINVFLLDRLHEDRATKNALTTSVLKRGTSKLKTIADISLFLEDLYGAYFDCGIAKKGEIQIMQFYADYVLDQYTLTKENIFQKMFSLLMEIIYDPYLENGVFSPSYVSTEKENHKTLIEGLKNDKMQYAIERCFEEMCKGEPSGIYEYGSIEKLDEVDEKNLYEHYKSEYLDKLPMKIFITGKMSEEDIDFLKKSIAGIKQGILRDVQTKMNKKVPQQVNKIVEKMPVTQGKLSLGFRTNVYPNTMEYYKLMVYNGILGGGVHSKLFANVREKASLAYFAFSRLEKYQGIMLIASGIEIENYEKARKIILEQMEDIKNGILSDEEFNATLGTIETSLNMMEDSAMKMVDFSLAQMLCDCKDTFKDIIQKTKQVTKEDVQAVATNIILDTDYFLTSDKDNEL